jgi:hypothetical protein
MHKKYKMATISLSLHNWQKKIPLPKLPTQIWFIDREKQEVEILDFGIFK